MSDVITKAIFNDNPGMGLNANPFEGEMYIDMTSPMGQLSGMYLGLMFSLRRFGFETLKIDESIDVSPVFKQYYDLTIQQKQSLEAQIKGGLGQIANAIHDYELIRHDLRKYKEYLDYFTRIEQGKNLLKKAKKDDEKEEAQKMITEGVQTLRSVFIDQVDAHTGEGIALRTITSRWPTIIVDFQRLDENETDQKKIAEKHKISEAEASILATKNKLFIEWRDNLFRPTLKERYENVLRLVEARKTSVQRYTDMLKPTIARYKLINDALESPEGRQWGHTGFFQPSAQAFSNDLIRIWAFMPFAPAEKYKFTLDYMNQISLEKAGFLKSEIKELEKFGVKPKDLVYALPAEPSIDKIVRDAIPEVQKTYKVQITIKDVYDARKRLTNLFGKTASERQGAEGGIRPGASWVFSPYWIFLDIPVNRSVIRLANGTEMEDLFIQNLTVKNRTQNVIIVTLLEVIAREKQLENYISRLLGELGGDPQALKTIEEMSKEEYPEFFGGERKEEKKEKERKSLLKDLSKTGANIENFLRNTFGVSFGFMRAGVPYEFAMDDRIAEMFQVETMVQGYLYVLRYLQQGMGVPGIRV